MCVCYPSNMNGDTVSHIAYQATLIEIMRARIEKLENDMNEFMENEGILWVYTQEGLGEEE